MHPLPLRSGLLIATLMILFLLAGCSARGGLERPNGVAVARDGSLYVMDFGHYRIAHLSPAGKLLDATGKFGPEPDQIYFGWDMAADPQGNLYFGNVIRDDDGTRHDGVKVYSPEGKFLREIGAADYPKNEDVAPALPYGIEVDSQGRVYTADYGTSEVRIFSNSGELLARLPGKDQPGYAFEEPGDVAVDDKRSLMYVTDFTLGRLLQFKLAFGASGKPEITFVQAFGEYGREPGQLAFPQNLAVNEDTGVIYVGDMANRRIQAFDSQGKYLESFAPPDVADWQALGLAVGQGGQVYAGDALNNVVWVFPGPGQPARKLLGTRGGSMPGGNN